MATIKQKLAFKQIMEKRGGVSTAMRAVGYEENTAKNPKNLTESKGFLELCEKVGLTDEFLTKALTEDIKKKPQNRKPELELAFRVKGRLKENEEPSRKNIINIFIAEQRRRIARRVLARNAGSEGASDRLLDSGESEV